MSMKINNVALQTGCDAVGNRQGLAADVRIRQEETEVNGSRSLILNTLGSESRPPPKFSVSAPLSPPLLGSSWQPLSSSGLQPRGRLMARLRYADGPGECLLWMAPALQGLN
jgi:hypothetical protein